MVAIGPIVATRMEAEAATMVHMSYAATLQVNLSDATFDRARDREQPSCGFS
jgi:hypothetical protein